jgi:hypothetical protein
MFQIWEHYTCVLGLVPGASADTSASLSRCCENELYKKSAHGLIGVIAVMELAERSFLSEYDKTLAFAVMKWTIKEKSLTQRRAEEYDEWSHKLEAVLHHITPTPPAV